MEDKGTATCFHLEVDFRLPALYLELYPSLKLRSYLCEYCTYHVIMALIYRYETISYGGSYAIQTLPFLTGYQLRSRR
jgi:hypothetical protein